MNPGVNNAGADDGTVQPPAANPTPSSGGGGSFFKSLLPTIGGIGGGILGGVVDAATLGLAAPLVNPITGAAAGGALGQAVENATNGKNPFEMNDVTSGIENGAGELVGAGAAKLAGKLGEGIVSAGAKAGEKAAQDAQLSSDAAKTMNDQEASNLNYGGIGQRLRTDLGLGSAQKFVDQVGYDSTNPEDMQKVAQAINSRLGNVYDAALQNAKPVSMSDAGELFGATKPTINELSPVEQKALQNQGYTPEAIAKMTPTGGGPEAATTYQGIERGDPIGQALSEYNRSIGTEPLAKLPDNMPAADVRKLQQAVGHQIGNVQKTVNSAELNGTYDATMHSKLDDLNTLYGKLGDRIKTPEVNQAISDYKLGDADVQGLKTTLGDKLGQYVADTVNNAKGADDLLTPMSQAVKADQLSDIALKDINENTVGDRATARLKFQQNGGIAPSSKSASGSAAGDLLEGAANTLHKPTGMVVSAARRLHEAGVTPKIAKGLGGVIKRTAPLLTPATQVASNIPNMAAGMTANASAIPQQGDPSMQPAATPPMNPNSPGSVLDTLMAQEQAAPTVLGPSLAPVIQGLAPQVQQQGMAANAISTLSPTYANAGGASGLGGGILDKLLAAVPGTAQNTYQSQAQATAAQIAKVLGITPEAAMAMLPQLAQNPNVAAPQLNATSGLVGQLTAGMPVQ